MTFQPTDRTQALGHAIFLAIRSLHDKRYVVDERCSSALTKAMVDTLDMHTSQEPDGPILCAPDGFPL
ncbi:hypothetical protein [Synechococcus sp. RS9902]|uniref:hypothetical protein n=1 Tax=Synechococcus sp. RS9902 TaxID=221345 RepID=UPI001CA4151E|nr:hypothetical protein [Synechococcus sp. RS9902]